MYRQQMEELAWPSRIARERERDGSRGAVGVRRVRELIQPNRFLLSAVWLLPMVLVFALGRLLGTTLGRLDLSASQERTAKFRSSARKCWVPRPETWQ